MATGGAGESRNWGDDFRNTCSLCMEPYRGGRQPKLLPCFHTFCLPCLTTLAASATTALTPSAAADNNGSTEGEQKVESGTEGTEEKGKEKAGEEGCKQEESGVAGGTEGVVMSPTVFLCPTCRSPVTVPEGGVENLQTNFYLDVDEVDTAPRPATCDMCDEGERQDATHYCTKCQQRMCRTCRRVHDKITDARTHQVQPLKAKEQPQKVQTRKTCQIHLDQSLCLHCVKCDISICMLCKLTSHEGHATEDMARANERAKEELKGLLTKANETNWSILSLGCIKPFQSPWTGKSDPHGQIQVVDTKLCHLDRRERELVRQKQEVTREVNMRYEKAVSTIARARDDVMEDLASREQAAIGGIRAEKMSARNTVETLSGLLNRARNETDVVSLKNEVQAALLSEEALDHCRQAASNEANSFFVYRADVPDLEVEVVEAYMGKLRNPDAAQTSPNQATVTFRHLVDAVADLKARLARVQDAITDNGNTLKKLTNLTTEVACLTTKVDDMQNTVAEVQADNSTTLAKLTSATSISENLESVVEFRAVLMADWKARKGPIIFGSVRNNVGDCYDSTTGVFTVPFDGLYSFHVNVRAAELAKDAELSLTINGHAYGWGRGTYNCYGSASVTAHLKSDDRVYVNSYNDGHYRRVETTFSGALILKKDKLCHTEENWSSSDSCNDVDQVVDDDGDDKDIGDEDDNDDDDDSDADDDEFDSDDYSTE